jgi:hypothetical protein
MYKCGSREYDLHIAMPFSIVVFCGEEFMYFASQPMTAIFLPAKLN